MTTDDESPRPYDEIPPLSDAPDEPPAPPRRGLGHYATVALAITGALLLIAAGTCFAVLANSDLG